MSVAPVMDHRKVEDWPASTVVGSAVKLLITGAEAVGGSGGCCVGGGGGGGGGTCFPQPTASNSSAETSSSMPALDACNLELSLILKSPLLSLFGPSFLLCCFTPNRFFIVALRGELLYLATVGQRGINLRFSPTRGGKHDVNAIGRPPWIFVSPRALGQLPHTAASHVHDKDIEISRLESTSPCKCDVLAIGAPRRVYGVALPGSQAAHIGSVNIHSIYLRCAAAPRNKDQIRSGAGIYLRLYFQRA